MFSIIVASTIAVLILAALILGAIAIEDLVKSMKKDREHRNQTDSQ